MSENKYASEKNYAVREEESGILEKIGVKYYQYMAKKAGISKMASLSIDDLPPDDVMCSIAANMTHFAAIIAFSVGALTTMISVWFEWQYYQRMDETLYYFYYGLIVIAMLVIEMGVLFWLSLKTVHGLACLTGHHYANDEMSLPGNDAVANILARAALEVPDPVVHYLGIDPLKHAPRTKLLFISVLYKAKVILSGLVIKFLFIRIFGKGSSRLGFTWIAIPITGIWDAFVMYKVAKEARLRLFGNRLAHYLADSIMQAELMDRLSPKAREGAIRAVATTMVLSQNYHPNMLILMIKLSDVFKIKKQVEYDNWDDFLQVLSEVETHERYFILDLLSVSAAFDGNLSRLERYHLPQAFGEYTDVYMARMENLTEALLNGRLHAAKALCQLDFELG
ncbi:MAG: hypothetical protein Q9M50_09855 [Methylococcales bacterium]|nr:hypothetical protein [Methylococcales bacterium]